MIYFIIIVVCISFGFTVMEWRTLRASGQMPPAVQISARQRFKRRLFGLALLLIELFLLVYYGKFEESGASPLMILTYFVICVVLAGVLFIVLIVDVRANLRDIFKAETNLSDDQLANLEKELESALKMEMNRSSENKSEDTNQK